MASDKEYFVVVIRADGTVERVQTSEIPTLEELQRLVGGYIESVPVRIPVSDKPVMIVNEEGKLKGLPRNRAATSVARLFEGDYVAGDAVLIDRAGEDLKAFRFTRAVTMQELVVVVAGKHANVKW